MKTYLKALHESNGIWKTFLKILAEADLQRIMLIKFADTLKLHLCTSLEKF